jgi:hypothetical protein
MKAIVCFQGFRESDHRRSGTEDLFFNVVRCFANESVTTYHPREWTTNVENLAAQLSRQGIRQVAMISYSHGQAAATAFADLAYYHGIKIPLWLACDPVYRPTWLPRWNILQPLSFAALLKGGEIHVPRNISRVVYVRQETTRPMGRTLVADAPSVVQDPLVLPYSHTAIDHAPEWFAMVRRELNQWLNPHPLP